MKDKIITRSLLAASFLLSIFVAVVAPSATMAQAEGNFTINRDWAILPEGQEWNGATSWVATDGKGKVLVLVRNAPYFRMFNTEGEFLSAWGEEDFFQNAHSVTFDNEGFIWATDAARHVLYKFSPAGELVMTLGSPDVAGDNDSQTLFNQANHVTVAPNGDLYVSDGYQNSRIVHLTSSGEFISIIAGEAGSENGQLQVPHGVALDSKGKIIVNDSGNQRVAVFDQAGNFLETWPFPSRGGIAVTADDTVYISDVNAGAINIVNNGELLETIQLDIRPHSLAVDSDGAIYVSDARGQVVMKITRKN